MARIIDTAEIDISKMDKNTAYWIYNGLDCCVTENIREELYPMLDDVAKETYEFSLALQAPILEMNMRGLLVNQRRKHKVIREMEVKLKQLENQLERIIVEGVGVPMINWRSPMQLNNFLYNVMELPVQKSRKQNGSYGPTSDRKALEKLSMYFVAEPICNHILLLRDLGKSIGFLRTSTDKDGRMRTSFNIAGTDTGRFSSAISDFGVGTNLQNVTSSLRSSFVADPRMKFCNLDLEQADSRNVGALCWELFADHPDWTEETAGAYLDACESGDLHTTVCKMASPYLGWGGDMSDREIADQIAYRGKSYRDNAKVLGHGSNYLGTPPTMSKHSKLPIDLVKMFQDNYFEAFPCIPAWHQATFAELEETAQLTTPFGRRRFFFDRLTEAATHRKAIAFVPQSMTAEQINLAILKLWKANRVQLLIQVHDSILFQYPAHLEDEIVPWALKLAEVTLKLKKGREFTVPTEAQIGWNWGYASEDNPDGLAKWKGHDSRRRQETKLNLSLRDF